MRLPDVSLTDPLTSPLGLRAAGPGSAGARPAERSELADPGQEQRHSGDAGSRGNLVTISAAVIILLRTAATHAQAADHRQ